MRRDKHLLRIQYSIFTVLRNEKQKYYEYGK